MSKKCETDSQCQTDYYCDDGHFSCQPCVRICTNKTAIGPKECQKHCPVFGYAGRNTETTSTTDLINKSPLPENDTDASTQSYSRIIYVLIVFIVVIVLLLVVCFYKRKYVTKLLKPFLCCEKKKTLLNSTKTINSIESGNIPKCEFDTQNMTVCGKRDEHYNDSNVPDSSPGTSNSDSGIGKETECEDYSFQPSDRGIPDNKSVNEDRVSKSLSRENEDIRFDFDKEDNNRTPSSKIDHSMIDHSVDQMEAGVDNPLLENNHEESHLEGAVGGEPMIFDNNILASAMPNMYDNDSGCGSVLNNGGRASEEFEQMNRQLYQERGVDVDRLGEPGNVIPQQDQQPVGRPLEELFPGVVNPQRQKNRPLYDELKKIDWVMGYHSAGESIEVYVNLGSLDPHGVEQQLADITGAPTFKFHVKQNEDTDFLYYSNKILIYVSNPIRVAPFFKNNMLKYNRVEWDKIGPNVDMSCVVGGFLSIDGDDGLYCLTVSHPLRKGGVCFVEFEKYLVLMGECVSIVNTVGFEKALCDKDSTLSSSHSENCESCVDLAIIKIHDENFEAINVIRNQGSQVGETYKFELFDWKNASASDVESLNECYVQMKNRHGNIKKGVISRVSCDFNDKVKNLQMHNQIMVKSEDSNEFLTQGDCGSLLTSIPDDKSRTVMVYGLFYGNFIKKSGEKSAVAFPLSSALEQASKKDFKGRKISLLKTPVNTPAECHMYKRPNITIKPIMGVKNCEKASMLDSGIDIPH